jgi:hypothetical protein
VRYLDESAEEQRAALGHGVVFGFRGGTACLTVCKDGAASGARVDEELVGDEPGRFGASSVW